MRRFLLQRLSDETGVSGTGFVAEGVQFTNAKCVLTWRTAPGGLGLTEWSSVAVYPNLAMVEKVHGHGGQTVVRFIDETDPPHRLDCPTIISPGLTCNCDLGLEPLEHKETSPWTGLRCCRG